MSSGLIGLSLFFKTMLPLSSSLVVQNIKSNKLIPRTISSSLRNANKKTIATQAGKFIPKQMVSFSRVGIVDTGVDMEHYDLKDRVMRLPVNFTSDGKDSVIVYPPVGINLVNDDDFYFNSEISELYEKDFLRFTHLHEKVSSFQSVDWGDVKWYLEKISDRDFILRLSKFNNMAHGTHVAGIASKDNPDAKIMSIRFLPDLAPSEDIEKMEESEKDLNELLVPSLIEDEMLGFVQNMLIESRRHYLNLINVANKFNIDVLNLSLGFMSGEKIISSIVDEFGFKLKPGFQKNLEEEYDRGIAKIFKMALEFAPNTLFIVAAGNDHEDMDSTPYIRTISKHPRGIVVAALDEEQQLARFSNYGKDSVNIAALGVNVVSSVPGDGLVSMSGTSQATPEVTRIASKIKDCMPELKPEDIKKILMKTLIKRSDISDKIIGGILDEDAALKFTEDLKQGRESLADSDSFEFEL